MSSKTPVLRQTSWPLVIPQLAAAATLVGIVHIVVRPAMPLDSLMIGCAIYLAYSMGSRHIIAAPHRAGMRLSQRGEFGEAILEFEKSYQFFAKHKWADQFRCIVLMNPSAISYREMDLLNIAYCHVQLGNAALAKEYCQKTLAEFPHSGIAKANLRTIEILAGSKDNGPRDPVG